MSYCIIIQDYNAHEILGFAGYYLTLELAQYKLREVIKLDNNEIIQRQRDRYTRVRNGKKEIVRILKISPETMTGLYSNNPEVHNMLINMRTWKF